MALSPAGLAELQHSMMLGLGMESWGQGCRRLCCLQHLLGASSQAVGTDESPSRSLGVKVKNGLVRVCHQRACVQAVRTLERLLLTEEPQSPVGEEASREGAPCKQFCCAQTHSGHRPAGPGSVSEGGSRQPGCTVRLQCRLDLG